MQSTLFAHTPEYIGADLTDRYSAACRDIDVCGLTSAAQNRLQATFWQWRWDAAPLPLNVAPIASEIRRARITMLDGPQALAAKGAALRGCERLSAAVGKTPDTRPALKKPFGGFIGSSLDLFTELKRHGISLGLSNDPRGVAEVYPGHVWTILSGDRQLPKKSTEAGRGARKRILEAMDVSGLPALPTHDQNDACLAALVAAAADNQVGGISVYAIGEPLSIDSEGELREGSMFIPKLTDAASERIRCALRDLSLPSLALSAGPSTAWDKPATRAEALLSLFIAQAVKGHPQVCTYSWAYEHLFETTYGKFSQQYARQVIDVARRTRPRELAGLGLVTLDSFVVSKRDALPSHGYWTTAHHDREDWERTLGNAEVLDARR